MAKSLNQRRDSSLLKLIALLTSIHWKSIAMVMMAQYIAFLFAFNVKEDIWNSLGEIKVHLIILSTGLVLSAGYIINNFYDAERDMINRPARTRFQNLVSKGFKLRLYVLLNVFAFVIAGYASLNILLFFIVFALALWVYSHKLSKLVLISELSASFLTVMGFFSLVLYFKMLNIEIILYGASLFLLVFARELYKDIIGYKGDLIYGYQSITTEFGLVGSKRLYQVIVLLSLVVDAGFLAINQRVEFIVLFSIVIVAKFFMLFLIERYEASINLFFKWVILLYVLGVAWL